MAYVYESTYGGTVKFGVCRTRKEAVSAALATLPGDWGDYFWASADGERIEETDAMLDFGLTVYNSVADALATQCNLDEYAMPPALRRLADAVEDFYQDQLYETE